MSSLSSPIRLFSPHILQIPKSTTPKPQFLSSKPFSTITFTSLPKSPIKSQLHPAPPSHTLDPSHLPANLQHIVALFQSVEDPKAKYHQLLHYGSKLPPFDPRYKNEDHRVRGCVSQVWVRAFRDPIDPAAVRFEADSDSALTKGLAALLVMGLSGATAPIIASVPPEFVHLLGLRQSLTPSRNNGFLNMLRLMQQKALELDGESEDSKIGGGEGLGLSAGEDSGKDGVLDEKDSIFDANAKVLDEKDPILDANGGTSEVVSEVSDGNGGLRYGDSGDELGSRGARIMERLEKELSPVELIVEDISYQHAGHAGVRGSGDGETHFNVRIVSKEFEGKSMVKRHRLVYGLLQEELQSGLHALSIVAKTPSEVC